jgi:hypothetical protein
MNGKDAYQRFNFNCYYHIKIEKEIEKLKEEIEN